MFTWYMKFLWLVVLLSCKQTASERCMSNGGMPRLVNCQLHTYHEHDVADLDDGWEVQYQTCDFKCVMLEQRFGHQAIETP